jgi:hypothetical protein
MNPKAINYKITYEIRLVIVLFSKKLVSTCFVNYRSCWIESYFECIHKSVKTLKTFLFFFSWNLFSRDKIAKIKHFKLFITGLCQSLTFLCVNHVIFSNFNIDNYMSRDFAKIEHFTVSHVSKNLIIF